MNALLIKDVFTWALTFSIQKMSRKQQIGNAWLKYTSKDFRRTGNLGFTIPDLQIDT